MARPYLNGAIPLRLEWMIAGAAVVNQLPALLVPENIHLQQELRDSNKAQDKRKVENRRQRGA
jgi:hypothetical protein